MKRQRVHAASSFGNKRLTGEGKIEFVGRPRCHEVIESLAELLLCAKDILAQLVSVLRIHTVGVFPRTMPCLKPFLNMTFLILAQHLLLNFIKL